MTPRKEVERRSSSAIRQGTLWNDTHRDHAAVTATSSNLSQQKQL